MDDITGVFGSLGQVNTGAVLFDIILTTLASMALGVLITLFYAYMNRKKGFTLEFSVTIIAISSVIAMIIAVIGTNIASAFSLAGIMSIVRFRSLQQKTSDIAFLFVAMAAGLTAGLGLLLPALAFVVLTGVLLNLYVFLEIFVVGCDFRSIVICAVFYLRKTDSVSDFVDISYGLRIRAIVDFVQTLCVQKQHICESDRTEVVVIPIVERIYVCRVFFYEYSLVVCCRVFVISPFFAINQLIRMLGKISFRLGVPASVKQSRVILAVNGLFSLEVIDNPSIAFHIVPTEAFR